MNCERHLRFTERMHLLQTAFIRQQMSEEK